MTAAFKPSSNSSKACSPRVTHPTTDLDAADIVVISMYAGDKLRLNKKLKERAESQKVLTADSFQSAEFKIVIIRLVSGQDSAGCMISMEQIIALLQSQCQYSSIRVCITAS